MSTRIFVNLPVKDLDKSVGFFTAMGFSFDQNFTDENATCMIIDDDIYAMLLVEPFFRSFTNKEIANTATSSEAITALGVDSKQQVDELVDKAFSAGAQPAGEVMDYGFMYGRSFLDLDGHHWEVIWMDQDQQG